MNSLPFPAWAEAYQVDFENLRPGDDLTLTQRKLIEILISFGIFVCEDLNKKMISLWDERQELQVLHDIMEG